MIKKYYKAAVDGIIWGMIMKVLTDYCISVYALESKFFDMLVVLICIILSVVSAVYLLRYERIRDLLTGCFTSFVSWMCVSFVSFAWIIIPSIRRFYPHIFPVAWGSLAAGLVFFTYGGMYLIMVISIRIILFVVRLIKVRKISNEYFV